MMIKEKSKNKPKIKQNKNPLPKIKPNTNNFSLKAKHSIYKGISESKNNNDLENLKINYQRDQRHILPKANLRIKNANSTKNSNSNTINKNRSKTGLKYLLKEYGLSEYHKKLNELGYNNDNYTEIGNLSRKNFSYLINNLNIFPLHYEKLEKFYDYLKKMNHNKKNNNQKLFDRMSSTTPQFPKRRFNFNLNSSNNFNLNNNKINSNENTKTNQIYNQYRNYYNNYIEPNYHNNIDIYNINSNINRKKYNRKTLNINRGNKNKIIYYQKAKSKPRPHTSNPKLYSNKNNYNNNLIKIRIRNNYSGKRIMKKKLKNFSLMNSPYLSNSIDDNSSLIRSYFNDYQNLAENHKMNLINQNMNIMDIEKINPINKKINNNNEEINILYKNQNNYLMNKEQNEYENEINENIERMLNQYMIQLNEKLDKSYDSIEDSSLSHIVTSQIGENQNKKEKVLPNYKLPKIKNEEIIINNKEKEKQIKEEGESSKDIKRLSVHDTSTKSKDSKEPQIEELLEEKKYITKEEAEKLLSDIDYNINDKRFNLEQNIYETLRLNKSFDEENNKKETIKYDIEFICRCLGLSLMKLIEQGQEKEHITELYDQNNKNKNKYNYYFMNEEFNENIFLIEEFFNDIINNKDNNKLLGDMNKISILENFYMKKGDINNNGINIVRHLKKTGDENYIIKDDNIDKLQSNLLDMDKELKFLGHFFSYKRSKMKDYQGLSENTKKILGKDLSYIKEIDSEINHTGSKVNNNSESKISKSDVNNNENNSNDSKNNQENLNKILDDSCEYEDEFLKEKFVDDLNSDSNLNKKEEEKEEEIITSKYNNSDLSNTNSNNNNNNNNISLKKYQEQAQNPLDIESSYIIDTENIKEFKLFLITKLEVFDEDYIYFSNSIPEKRLMQPPDPQTIFEFCANIMLLTKMEKETIIVALIYIERLIFNSGLLITSRNWRKLIFTALIMASKLWDDDSLENIHFSQIFTHLKIGEINLLERNFLELINYNVFVKFSEFMKYYFALKEMCLKFNYNGERIIGIKPDKIIRIQEYRYQLQKRMSKTMSLNNSASF